MNYKKNVAFKENNTHKSTKKKKKVIPKKLHRTVEQAIIASRRGPRNFDFEVDWPRVDVSDQVLRRIAEWMDLDEADAFDRAMDILECNQKMRFDAKWIYRSYLKKGFRGDWVHLAWYTFENIQIGIENNRWVRINYSQRDVHVPDDLCQQLYDAEDGRCEICGQAMHFRTARFLKRDWNQFGSSDNLELACYSCASGRKNVLLSPELVIEDRNMKYLRERMGMESEEAVKAYIRENLKFAVHTNTFNPNKGKNRRQVKDLKIRGQYWLPQIGRCRLQYRFVEGKKQFTLEFTECAREPKLVIKKQGHTRGLAAVPLLEANRRPSKGVDKGTER